MPEPEAPAITGLLIDWGGVLTSDVFVSFEAFCGREGLPPDTVRDAFMRNPEARQLLHDLETGARTETEFATPFAALLGVADADGLCDRLFSGISVDEAMLDAVRAAKRAGVRTGLISNSWGEDRYDRDTFPALFDGVVISGEEGIRKPHPDIYALGAERAGRLPEECVYVDDLAGNLKPARALGMTTLHHTSAEETIAQLEAILGVPLR